jgi:S-adenosylmethionine hydrolase
VSPRALLLALGLACAPVVLPPALSPPASFPTAFAAGPPTVVFLSDFGTRDDAVAICKGVMLAIEPSLRVIDLTHEVTPFAVADGARLLADTAAYYPADTVFVAVIDPGVGSARKPLVARSKRGQLFVVPDNGLLTLVADRDGLEGAREITNGGWMRAGGRSSTFHGRDVFAPVAAHLAHGEPWTDVGPPVDHPVRLALHAATIERDVLRGEIIATDGPYGNLITNVDATTFTSLGWTFNDRVPIEIGKEQLTVPFVHTFSDVAVGKPLLYIDSRARLGVAINKGDFAKSHHVTPPTSLKVHHK